MPKVVSKAREAARREKPAGPSINVDNAACTLLSQYNGDDFERLHEDDVLCEWTIFIHKVQDLPRQGIDWQQPYLEVELGDLPIQSTTAREINSDGQILFAQGVLFQMDGKGETSLALSLCDKGFPSATFAFVSIQLKECMQLVWMALCDEDGYPFGKVQISCTRILQQHSFSSRSSGTSFTDLEEIPDFVSSRGGPGASPSMERRIAKRRSRSAALTEADGPAAQESISPRTHTYSPDPISPEYKCGGPPCGPTSDGVSFLLCWA